MSGKGSLKDAFALLSALAFVPAAGLLCTLLFGIEAASRRFGPLGQRLASPLHSLPFEVCNVLCTAMGCLLGGILWTPGTYWRRDHPWANEPHKWLVYGQQIPGLMPLYLRVLDAVYGKER